MSRFYTEEEKKWLRKNYIHLGRVETTKLFNEKFNHNKNEKTVEKYCHNRLGLRVTEERRTNRYKAFSSEVGTVSRNCRGEYKIKTESGWIPLTHSMLEVPKGYVAIHLDGNKDNNESDNIMVVKNGIQTIVRNANLWSNNRQISKAAFEWAELYKALYDAGVSRRKLSGEEE